MAFISMSEKSVESQFSSVAFVDGVTVDILLETCLEGAAVCAQVGSSEGSPRGFISVPLAHKLDWVSTRLGLLMCGTVEK